MNALYFGATLATTALLLSACAQTAPSQSLKAVGDQCGASNYQNLVGGPSSAAIRLTEIPSDSRHYGSKERVATNDPMRLNFVHSGTAVESVTNPNSTIIRVFCG